MERSSPTGSRSIRPTSRRSAATIRRSASRFGGRCGTRWRTSSGLTMRGCENWATEATATVALVVGLALGTPGAPAAAAVAPAEGPADLQRVLDKVEKELGKAEAAVRGKDPGRV